jgi:putative oxidoreductase
MAADSALPAVVGVPVVPDEPAEASVPNPSAASAGPGSAKAATVLRWVVVAIFVGAGSAKLLGMPSMVSLFQAVGLGQWLRYTVGICELTGAILLMMRRTVLPATFLLSGLLIGAAATEIVVLRRLPLKSSATLLGVLIVAVSSLRPRARQDNS